MPEAPVPLDYESPTKARGTVYRVGDIFIFAAFLAALVYLLVSHSNPGAPMRIHQSEFTFYSESERHLKNADADPRGAAIHFKITEPVPVSVKTARLFARIYYMAQYIRAPNRLIVGADDQIINNEEQLLAADRLPPIDWMQQQKISAVYLIHDTDILGPLVDVIPVP